MKRLTGILLVLILLAGCSNGAPTAVETTTQATLPEVSQETTALPTEMEEPGTYLPDSAIEMQTNGAVRVYDPGIDDYTGLVPFGEDVLVLSGDQVTTLTLLKGENLTVEEQTTLDCLLTVSDSGLQVNAQGIAYYDGNNRAVVFLDESLRQTGQVNMPDDMLGSAVVSPDWSAVYYCTAEAVYAIDMHTGLSRILKEQDSQWQSITGIYFNGQILSCYTEDFNSVGKTVYLSAQTGETLHSGEAIDRLITDDDIYFAEFYDGSVELYLIGKIDEQPQTLRLPQETIVLPVLSLDGIVLLKVEDQKTDLGFVDVITGEQQSGICLDGNQAVQWITAIGEQIWMVASYEKTGEEILYSWDPSLSPVQSDMDYIDTYYTADAPDTIGLAKCKTQADVLGEKYGVDILLWEDALQFQPWDYVFEAEFRVETYERDLAALEKALAKFPEGFFAQTAAGTNSGRITISLVRRLDGDAESGSLENVYGAQYWIDESAYIVLAMGTQLDQSFYHELCHLIDNRVISTSKIYDDWQSLNPWEFEYDYDYLNNQSREDYQYLEEENRAFIDVYSMSYPKEDRARIFEYAMMPDNASYFTSEIMQRKLLTICMGIREAFTLDSQMTYPWEQYLTESIASEE